MFDPDAGYVTTCGSIHGGSAARRGLKKISVPSRPGKSTKVVFRIICCRTTIATWRDKLKHVLQNLIDNALKFTEAGQVTITAARQPAHSEMTFTVEDTGIGIPLEQLIFEKFRQVDSAANRGYDGADWDYTSSRNSCDCPAAASTSIVKPAAAQCLP